MMKTNKCSKCGEQTNQEAHCSKCEVLCLTCQAAEKAAIWTSTDDVEYRAHTNERDKALWQNLRTEAQ